MAPLRELLAAAGFADVRTYVQSGNVVLSSTTRSAPKVAQAVRTVLRDGFGADVTVVVRTPAQLEQVIAWDPFPEQARDRPQHTYVLFLTGTPDRTKADALLAEDWTPDSVAARGAEVAITYADALSQSRLQHSVALRRLGVDGTARNWRTVQAILDLC
jgi:uncharacterized protein (DUF1697 family)